MRPTRASSPPGTGPASCATGPAKGPAHGMQSVPRPVAGSGPPLAAWVLVRKTLRRLLRHDPIPWDRHFGCRRSGPGSWWSAGAGLEDRSVGNDPPTSRRLRAIFSAAFSGCLGIGCWLSAHSLPQRPIANNGSLGPPHGNSRRKRRQRHHVPISAHRAAPPPYP